MRAQADTAHRNGHDTRERDQSGTSVHACFACGSPLSPRRFREVQAKRVELIDQIRATLILERDAEIAKIRDEAAGQVAMAKATIAGRETTIRKEAAAAATAALIHRITKAEQAKTSAEQQAKKLKSEQEKTIQARIEAERKTAAKKLTEAVNAERAKGYAERLKLTETVEDLKRRLEKRTPGELGDEGELDLFERLRSEWPDDVTERVRKFASGGDARHDVIHNGQVVGRILFDYKNTKTFQTKWTAKLRQDQIAAQADHAVLVTTAFKSGHEHLMFVDGVLVVSPPRVIELVKWLRSQIVRNHSLRLTQEARDGKSQRLYEFMCSDKVADRWSRLAQTVRRMRDALRSERLSHEKAWTDRTDKIGIIDTIRNEFVEDLDGIFESTVESTQS